MPQGWVDTGHTLTATSPACPEVPSSLSWEPTCLTQTAYTVAFSITQLCQETHIAAGNTSPSHTLPAASLKFQIISTFSRIHRPFPRHFYLFLNFNKVEFSFMTAIYYRVHECIYYFKFWPKMNSPRLNYSTEKEQAIWQQNIGNRLIKENQGAADVDLVFSQFSLRPPEKSSPPTICFLFNAIYSFEAWTSLTLM